MKTLALLMALVAGDIVLKNEGVSQGPVVDLNCVGAGINCTRTGSSGTLTITAVTDAGVIPTFVKPLYYDGGSVGCNDASPTDAGCVSISAQSFAGDKRFTGALQVEGAATFDSDINYYRAPAGNAYVAQAYPASGTAMNWLMDLASDADLSNSSTSWFGNIGAANDWATHDFTGTIVGAARRGTGTTKNLYLFAHNGTGNGGTNLQLSDMTLVLEAQTLRSTFRGPVEVDGGVATLSDVTVSGLKVPVVHGNGTAAQAFESGASTFVAGSKAITFTTAFGAAPVCVCSDTGGSVLACATGTSSTTAVTFFGTVTDAFNYACVGQR